MSDFTDAEGDTITITSAITTTATDAAWISFT
jgi:hypothetical protein